MTHSFNSNLAKSRWLEGKQASGLEIAWTPVQSPEEIQSDISFVREIHAQIGSIYRTSQLRIYRVPNTA